MFFGIIKRKPRIFCSKMRNVYSVALPFYYLTKMCGFSTYTIGKRRKTPSKSHFKCLNNSPVNPIATSIALAIHFTVISTVIYAVQDAKIVPPSAHTLVNVGSQHVITLSVSSAGYTVAFWMWKRTKINGIINEIYFIDNMVC